MSLLVKLGTSGVSFGVQARPGSFKNELSECLPDGSIKIKLKAKAIEQKANIALLSFLSECLNLPKSKITIKKGQTSRKKEIHIASETPEKMAVFIQETLNKISASST